MNDEDVGMVEARDRPGFLFEPPEPILVPRELRGQDFYGDWASKPNVAGSIDHSHATRAQGAENLIGAEQTACGDHAASGGGGAGMLARGWMYLRNQSGFDNSSQEVLKAFKFD
jgi:hypothetical protein